MGLSQRNADIQYPPVSLVPSARSRARFLLNTHYARIYGPLIRAENCRSMRLKIIQIEKHMLGIRMSQPVIYKTLARQCVDFERICALLEVLE